MHSINEEGCIFAWQTPIFKKIIPTLLEVNNFLKDLIILEEKKKTPVSKSALIGGTQLPEDFLKIDHPVINIFKEVIYSTVWKMINASIAGKKIKIEGDLAFEAWANIMRTGDYFQSHRHEGFIWSGIYYVDIGDCLMANNSDQASFSGALRLEDPRSGVNMLASPGRPFGGSLTVKPEQGMLLVFPSWLVHSVATYFGNAPRISIAFNAIFANYKVSTTEDDANSTKNIHINDSLSNNR